MDEIRPEIDTPVYVQLAAVIRGMIERGEILPRHPIPSQRYCRERWGVSGSTFDRATERRQRAPRIRQELRAHH